MKARRKARPVYVMIRMYAEISIPKASKVESGSRNE